MHLSADRKGAHLKVLIKVLHSLPLDLDAPQPLPLHLPRRLDGIVDLALDEHEQRAAPNAAVRPEGHEPVREAVRAHGEVRLGVRRPLLLDRDAAAPDNREVELEGVVVSRRADENVQLGVRPVGELDARRGDALDRGGLEVNLHGCMRVR